MALIISHFQTLFDVAEVVFRLRICGWLWEPIRRLAPRHTRAALEPQVYLARLVLFHTISNAFQSGSERDNANERRLQQNERNPKHFEDFARNVGARQQNACGMGRCRCWYDNLPLAGLSDLCFQAMLIDCVRALSSRAP